jgi:threonylcarbamoyladenosine tRNA methylthiotransferase MtaB
MFENSLKLVEDCGLTWLHIFPFSQREGTPAARMPQMDRSIIKERAARLRAAGDEQVHHHLNAQIQKRHNILMESPRMGRTEGFTEVYFDIDQPVGKIVKAQIIGRNDTQLVA